MTHRVRYCGCSDVDRAAVPLDVKAYWRDYTPFLERAMVARSAIASTLTPVGDEELVWRGEPMQWLTGDIFVDGSGSAFRWLWEAVRAGWGVAQVTGRVFVGGFYGNLTGDCQTVPRAELVAIARALAVAKKPFRIVSDHLNHVEAIGKGKA